jgi:hypothetical protein
MPLEIRVRAARTMLLADDAGTMLAAVARGTPGVVLPSPWARHLGIQYADPGREMPPPGRDAFPLYVSWAAVALGDLKRRDDDTTRTYIMVDFPLRTPLDGIEWDDREGRGP